MGAGQRAQSSGSQEEPFMGLWPRALLPGSPSGVDGPRPSSECQGQGASFLTPDPGLSPRVPSSPGPPGLSPRSVPVGGVGWGQGHTPEHPLDLTGSGGRRPRQTDTPSCRAATGRSRCRREGSWGGLTQAWRGGGDKPWGPRGQGRRRAHSQRAGLNQRGRELTAHRPPTRPTEPGVKGHVPEGRGVAWKWGPRWRDPGGGAGAGAG